MECLCRVNTEKKKLSIINVQLDKWSSIYLTRHLLTIKITYNFTFYSVKKKKKKMDTYSNTIMK